MQTPTWVEWAARALELTGVAAIVVGAAWATVAGALRALKEGMPAGVQRLRNHLGRSMSLGLEFLVAADILRTVTGELTLYRVGTLALIIFVRTFLSFTLHIELEGRWPWQGKGGDDRARA